MKASRNPVKLSITDRNLVEWITDSNEIELDKKKRQTAHWNDLFTILGNPRRRFEVKRNWPPPTVSQPRRREKRRKSENTKKRNPKTKLDQADSLVAYWCDPMVARLRPDQWQTSFPLALTWPRRLWTISKFLVASDNDRRKPVKKKPRKK